MEENNLMTSLMNRFTQLLADLQTVRAGMGEVLIQLVAWDEQEFIEASTLGWPHDPSLKTWIKEWLIDAVGQDGVTPSELSRTFAFGTTGPVLVLARHVLDHFWLVTTHKAVYREDGRAGAEEGNETAVAVVRIGPEDGLNRSGGEPAGGLQFRYGRDEYGRVEWVGMPPGLHGVHNIADMDIGGNFHTQSGVADILRRMGAPQPATDYDNGWEDVFIEEPGWLWIMYRRNRPRRR